MSCLTASVRYGRGVSYCNRVEKHLAIEAVIHSGISGDGTVFYISQLWEFFGAYARMISVMIIIQIADISGGKAL